MKKNDAEAAFTNIAAGVTAMQTRVKFITTFITACLGWYLSSVYYGQTLGYLPFQNVPWYIRKLTQKNLVPDKVTGILLPNAVSFTCVFLLVNMGPKSVFSKVLTRVLQGPNAEPQGTGIKAMIQHPSTKNMLKKFVTMLLNSQKLNI